VVVAAAVTLARRPARMTNTRVVELEGEVVEVLE
jgi:hypothetical protein